MTQTKQTAPFPEYYSSKSVGMAWHLHCRVCGEGWALKKESGAVGNSLKLLDHARSHDEAAWDKVNTKGAA